MRSRQALLIRRCKRGPKGFSEDSATVGEISQVKDIVNAVVYLTEAEQVTGKVLRMDGGANIGK